MSKGKRSRQKREARIGAGEEQALLPILHCEGVDRGSPVQCREWGLHVFYDETAEEAFYVCFRHLTVARLQIARDAILTDTLKVNEEPLLRVLQHRFRMRNHIYGRSDPIPESLEGAPAL